VVIRGKVPGAQYILEIRPDQGLRPRDKVQKMGCIGPRISEMGKSTWLKFENKMASIFLLWARRCPVRY